MSESDRYPTTRPGTTPIRGVAIGGFMGTGKSTVAPRLAEALELPWVDTDEVLARRHGPIAAQFADEGEAVFRQRERALIEELCDGAPRVVSTGGGVWADAVNRARLGAHFRTVVLTAPLSVIEQRVFGDRGRPLSGKLRPLYEARRTAYEDAELVIDTSLQEVDAVVREVLAWLEK